jgi:hypothetical protein
MDTVRLRTLTWKSVFWFGEYNGMKVQQVFDLNHYPYLRYVYYHYEGISFIDEILSKIGVFNQYADRRIQKPGRNMELYTEIQHIMFSQLVHKTNFRQAVYTLRIGAKLKQRRTMNKEDITFSRGNLQRMNQGHSYKR